MKIPKSLKLPRKLKKEVKKGFNRNIKSGPPVMSSNAGVVSCSMYQTVSYSGSNTKSFRRLCKYARKEEKRVFDKMMQDAINRQLGLGDGWEDIIQMQRDVNKKAMEEESLNYNPNDGFEDMLLGRRLPPDNKIIAVFPLNNKTIAGTHEY